MIRFLLIGLLRDRHRSLLPVMVVAIGVMLTVVFQSWLAGIFEDSIEFNALFSTGHVKVTTMAYADNSSQMPNDLALLNTGPLLDTLRHTYPDMDWIERIHFAGLVDVPDAGGETRAQGNAVGFGIDMLSGNTTEIDRMNIRESVVRGRLPRKPGEALMSDVFAKKIAVKPGDTISLISSSMYGEMAVYNFVVSGTVALGTNTLERGTLMVDISDARKALNMEDATGEILGLFSKGYYNAARAKEIAKQFNARFNKPADEFSPVMKSLREQSNMGMLVDYASTMLGILVTVFLVAMSIVLWNAGLLGGLRRYGEFGMRLAIGEEKGHVYKTMIYESLLIGITGSVIGVFIGMSFAFYLQQYGVNFGTMMQNATILMPTVMKAHITSTTWLIGFIPGIFSTLVGTMLSGIGIYKRQTAQLFKELEA